MIFSIPIALTTVQRISFPAAKSSLNFLAICEKNNPKFKFHQNKKSHEKTSFHQETTF